MSDWLNGRLSKSDIDQIETSVANAERITSGEIVPVILKRSSTVGHIPFIIFLIFMVLLLLFDVSTFLEENLFSPWLMLPILIMAMFISRFFGEREFIQRLLTSRRDQNMQVQQRAELEFYESNIKQTDGSTGVLLFVSLMERQVVVLADKAIAEKLPADTWQGVVEAMLEQIKQGKIAKGFCQGIEKSGQLLTDPFPIQPDDVNELPNNLIIKEF